jgi:hypothetical protein
MNEVIYKGKRIVHDTYIQCYAVYGFRAWGETPGITVHRFHTLTQAKAFIDDCEQAMIRELTGGKLYGYST